MVDGWPGVPCLPPWPAFSPALGTTHPTPSGQGNMNVPQCPKKAGLAPISSSLGHHHLVRTPDTWANLGQRDSLIKQVAGPGLGQRGDEGEATYWMDSTLSPGDPLLGLRMVRPDGAQRAL